MKDPFDEFRTFVTNIESSVQALAKAHGIEHLAGPQGITVMYLWKNRDKEIFIKDIEKRLNISKSVASNLIKRMAKNGFIEVIPSKKDKRYKQIVLSALGMSKAEKIIVFHKAVDEQLLKDVDLNELEIAKKVFLQIRKNLEKGVSNVKNF